MFRSFQEPSNLPGDGDIKYYVRRPPSQSSFLACLGSAAAGAAGRRGLAPGHGAGCARGPSARSQHPRMHGNPFPSVWQYGGSCYLNTGLGNYGDVVVRNRRWREAPALSAELGRGFMCSQNRADNSERARTRPLGRVQGDSSVQGQSGVI